MDELIRRGAVGNYDGIGYTLIQGVMGEPERWYALPHDRQLPVMKIGPSLELRATEPVPDPEVIAQLLEHLREAERRATVATGRADRAEASRDQLDEKISRIRQYAIEKNRDGSICKDGLDEFLRQFDLKPDVRRYKIDVTAYSVIEIDAADEETAKDRVSYLYDGMKFSGESREDNAYWEQINWEFSEITTVDDDDD